MTASTPNAASSEPVRVAYLAGTSYCGSTLAAYLAASHPEIGTVGEATPTRKWRRESPQAAPCSCGQTVDTCPFWTALFERMQADGVDASPHEWRHAYSYINRYLNHALSMCHGTPFKKAAQRALWASLPFHESNMKRADVANESFIRAALALTSASVFFDTTKDAYRLFRLLKCKSFDVCTIRLVRDVRAFVASERRHGAAATDAATAWRNTQKAIASVCDSMDPARVMTIQYEKLAGDAPTWMNAIYEHVGVEKFDIPTAVDPRSFHVLGNRTTGSGMIQVKRNERWRDELSAEECDIALSIGGEVNEMLGYTNE